MWRGCARQKSHQLSAGPDNQTAFVCSLFGLTQVTKRRDLACVRPGHREPGSLLRAWLWWAVNQTRSILLELYCYICFEAFVQAQIIVLVLHSLAKPTKLLTTLKRGEKEICIGKCLDNQVPRSRRCHSLSGHLDNFG